MNRATWSQVKAGYYRRRDGKGVINKVGPRDWAAQARLGVPHRGALSRVGNGHTLREAMSFVDKAVPPCAQCEGSGFWCGLHGSLGECGCPGIDCGDCHGK